MLLALLTALIVARPGLRGESLGLVSDLSDPGGLIWTALVLLGCGVWAGWRLWAGREAVHVGRVELATLAGLTAVFVGVGWAAYHRAALLGGWELTGLLLLLFLTRQLATTEREKHGLYAVLLATGVALSVQAAYQRGWELPRARAQAVEFKDGPRAWVSRQFEHTFESPSDGEREVLTRRVLDTSAHATFLFPSSLAAVLALAVPGLVAAAVVALRGQAEGWQVAFAAACALVGGLALLFTGAWLALLAALVASVVAAGRGKALAWVGGLGLAAAAGAALYATGALTDTLTQRAEAWAVTWRMLADGHLWTGVGAGHFGFYYPAHMRESDGAPATDGNSAVLDLWAAGGVAVPLAAVAAGLFVGLGVWRWWRATTAQERDEATTPGAELPWEFYLGGMLGVLFAFVLRTSSLAEADILNIALLAAVGSLAWFAAYALFEQVVWTPAERVTALTAGVAAMALAMLTGPGADRPAVAAFLFLAVGLLLAHVEPVPWGPLTRPGLAMGLPVPALLGAAFGFFLLVVVPTGNTASATRKARIAGFLVNSYHLMAEADRTIKDPIAYLREHILEPLRLADLEEPGVVRTNALMAEWHAQLWARTLLERESDDVQRRAVLYARRATDLCAVPAGKDEKGQPVTRPVGVEGLLTEYMVRQIFVRRMLAIAAQLEKEAQDPKMAAAQKTNVLRVAAERRTQARDSARRWSVPLVEAALERDPTNPRLAYRLAEAWDSAGDRARRKEARERAMRMSEAVGEPRRLSNAQRGQLEEWEKQDSAR